jgi:CRP-like cAMP-binding protein
LPPDGTVVESASSFENLSFFQGLSTADLKRILANFRCEEYRAGEVFFQQDQSADRLYLLVSGRVEIRFKPYDGEALTVSVIEDGGVFGWSAALGRPSYTSGAVCTADCRCLSIRGRDLRRICEEHPATGVILLERLAEVIAERLTSTHDHVVELLRQGMYSGREVRNR